MYAFYYNLKRKARISFKQKHISQKKNINITTGPAGGVGLKNVFL
jgi:hypothetical protein